MIKMYKIRVNRHKFYKKAFAFITKMMAKRILKLGGWSIKISNIKEGIDHYPYCKHREKDYCTRRKYWKGYLSRKDKDGNVTHGYQVLGTYEEEIYLEVIKLLLFQETIFPFCK